MDLILIGILSLVSILPISIIALSLLTADVLEVSIPKRCLENETNLVDKWLLNKYFTKCGKLNYI